MNASAWMLQRLADVDRVEHPVALAVLVAFVLAVLVRSLRRRPAAIAWPALFEARAAGGRQHDPSLVLARFLRAGALLALAIVLAGPLASGPRPKPPSQGLDLVLVVDTSMSMRALDAEGEGEWQTRLELARQVVKRFALHRVADGDRVGLVVFGETAFTHCPLTQDGRLLGASVERIVSGMAGEATALGDALALAVKRATPEDGEAGVEPLAGRLVVLLTDGRSNAGAIPPDVAAGLAAARSIRVHTVGIGSEGGVPIAGSGGATWQGLRFERHDLDRHTLQGIASATGGRYFEARSPRDLQAVYREIDALERIPRPEVGHPALRAAAPEPFLAIAGALLAAELAATRVLRRRLP